jgi:phosphoglycolate phosphatase
MPKPAIIFDLDGTLIDSAPDIHAVANHVLGAEGLPPLPFDQVRSFIGNGVAVLVARCLAAHEKPATPEKVTELAETLSQRLEETVQRTTLYPGVKNALQDIHKAGYNLGICTNKPLAPTNAILRHFDLEDYFSVIVGGDSLAQRKPDPAPLILAQAKFGGGPIIFVGDSEIDAATAKAAGFPFWLYTEGYRKTEVQDIDYEWVFRNYIEFSGKVLGLQAH